LRPFAPERRAVADAYSALAGYARAPNTPTLQSAAAALATAADAIGPGTTFPGERGTLRWLLEQGEWIRLELAAAARSPAPGVDATLGATANVLDAIAEARDPAGLLSDLRSHAQAIDETAARRRAAALAACVTAAAGESGTALPSPAPHTRPLRSLREQLTLDSRSFRHAVRLSVSLIAAGIAYRGLSLGVGYWVPLTVLFVLRPDYGTTITRGIGRAAGTAAGVTIAWVIVTALSPGSAAIVALLALLAFAAYALFPANYALYSVVLPVLIALLVEFSGGSPVGALLDRILDTALGTAIALGTYLAWPTREAPHMLESLALYVTAEGRWLDAILNAYAGHDGPSMRSMRLDARRARTNAWDAVRRALAEPPRRRPDDQPLGTTLATMDEISDSALVLAAAVHDGIRAPRDALAPYRRALAASFADLARVFRADARPTTKPPRDAGLTAVTTDPGLEAVTTEAAIVLTKLNWLEQTWQESTRPPNQHRSFDRGRDVD